MLHPLFFKEAELKCAPDEIVLMGFGFVDAPKGSQDDFDHSVNTIAILLSGKVRISGVGFETIDLEGPVMVPFPANFEHQIEILEDATAVFLYIMGDIAEFCKSMLSTLSADKLPPKDKTLHALPVKPILLLFTQQMAAYLGDRKIEKDISMCKQQELITLLNAYYTQDQINYLLVPFYQNTNSFYNKVMEMGGRCLSVEQMAAQMEMSYSTFVRCFHKVFNKPPKAWLVNMKARQLYKALYNSDEPLVSITKRLNFSSQQRMSAFCKANLGGTPMDIRNGEVVIDKEELMK